MQSIAEGNLEGNQMPSKTQYYFAKSLGRLMAEWSPAPFFMDYVAQRRYQWYYFDVVAKLRQDFEMRVTPALVPNYLARGIGPAVHARRLELEECDRKGKPPGAFGNVLILLKVLSLNETPRVCAGDRLILKPVNIPEFFLEA
ncbi:hypothetical protein B0H14DRAFT_2567894 [Mycena olivaceomarginata]|nr:hypothetical protein B0H14DRAFT_2567894 [Mycena olivaceomarginata]